MIKKLLVVFAAPALVSAFSLAASAADWNFYGSARMATFYTTDSNPGGSGGDGTQWDLNVQTRIGVRVKHESNVDGRIEIGLTDDVPGGGNAYSRRIFGEWDFGAGKLKVGKDYTPVTEFIFGQTFNFDGGLLGRGNYYGQRQGQIGLSFGGFEFAAVTQNDKQIDDINGVGTDGDIKSYIPKLEARWSIAGDTFNFSIFGGFQYYTIDDVTPVGGGRSDDIDVTSWVIGGRGRLNFGPTYIKGTVSYDQNGEEAGWLGPRYVDSSAFWDGDDDIKDSNVFQAGIAAGFVMSDMVRFEAGVGYDNVSSDLKGSDDSNLWAAYGNAVIALAPGVWIIPEVGYYDNDVEPSNGHSAGNLWYAGGKWQIDF